MFYLTPKLLFKASFGKYYTSLKDNKYNFYLKIYGIRHLFHSITMCKLKYYNLTE